MEEVEGVEVSMVVEEDLEVDAMDVDVVGGGGVSEDVVVSNSLFSSYNKKKHVWKYPRH